MGWAMGKIDPLLPDDDAEASESEELGNWRTDSWDNPLVVSEMSVSREPPDRPELRRLFRLVIPVMITFALVVGALGLWYVRQVNPSGIAEVASTFTVNEGESLDSVSKRLQAQGLIANAWVFRFYVARHGGLDLESGYYSIKADDHMGNVMRILRTPPSQTYAQVTFPEGYTIAQIGQRLSENTRLDAAKFIEVAESGTIRSDYQPDSVNSLEGLLFPDTYQVSGSQSEAQMAERMADLMERVGRQEELGKSQAKVGYTPYQVLIVASMIEREAKVNDDRAKIARVIYNRLNRKMLLQIDATLMYKQDPNLTFADLKVVDTPYNTYLHKGLPPTPIANPGRASIHAALNPAPNPAPGDAICKNLPEPTNCEYLYYVVADATGKHVFAATLAQHQVNVEKARQAGLLS